MAGFDHLLNAARNPNQSVNGAEAHATFRKLHYQTASIQWAVSSYSFPSVLVRLIM